VNIISKNDVATILSKQYFNKKNYNFTAGYLSNKWVSSESFELRTIDINSVDVIVDVAENQLTRSIGPIIVDYNKNRIPYKFSKCNNISDIIILDGKHRWTEAKNRGERTIQAYIGNNVCDLVDIHKEI
jgi:hypothetical protein